MNGKSKMRGLLTLNAIALCSTMGLAACSNKTTPVDPTPAEETGYQETTVDADGTTSGYTSEKGKFYSDYNSLQDAYKHGKNLNIRLAEEGDVLLKNANHALPLTRDEKNITLFGVKSVDLQSGGGGSGAGRAGYYEGFIGLQDSLESAGFNINQKVMDLYSENIAACEKTISVAGGSSSMTITEELPMSYYNDMITKTYGSYHDAAIITFARTGAEGYDLPTDHVDGHSNDSDHMLQLSDAEKALVKHVKKNFSKVIVLINSSNIMELADLNEEKTADNLGVDAILWIGHVGEDGAQAIGSILNGEVNPSGHTVDLWSKDFKKDPSWTNFGAQTQNGLDDYLYLNGTDTGFRSVEYREDIYNGYRYYETIASDMNEKQEGSGDNWYQENVVYPFGYGLSYTSFEWELVDAGKGRIASSNSTVTMQVKVTNTGDVAGKDVVQVYAETPYKKGGIEKASTVLMGFEKTRLLKPQESQTLTIQFVAQDMASFDWNDKNENGFVGYELEAGNYNIVAARNSHTPVFSVTRTIAEDIHCETDYTTGKTINAVFSQTEGNLADFNTTNDALLDNLISRNDGLSQPKASTKEDRSVTQAWLDKMEGTKNYTVSDDKTGDPWYVTSVPSDWKQASSHEADYSDVKTKIIDMAGVAYNHNVLSDGKVTEATDSESKKWTEFMNQLTWQELCQIASQGSYGRPSVESIGKPFETDIDGPAQIAWFGDVQAARYYPDEDHNQYPSGVGTRWVTAVVVASTWNDELAKEQGLQVGNESILTNAPGWYGPSLNTHRHALGGRNFEYYSEDPLISGKMAAAVTDGATSKGVVCYAKHMFLNEQETDRDTKRGISTYVTEQAIREIYLRPFEYIIKKGHSLGTMAASNRIGDCVAFGNYALHNAILRDEWDFKGMNITDSTSGNSAFAYASMDHLVRNGIDMPLGVGSPIPGHSTYGKDDCEYYLDEGTWNASENMVYVDGVKSPTQYYSVRTAAMHVLYASANSNGIDNGIKSTVNDVVINSAIVNQELIPTSSIDATGMKDMAEVIEEGGTSNLPEGLKLSSTGILSGSVSTPGTYTIKVSFLADGWVKKTTNVTIRVSDMITYSNGKLSQTAFNIGDTISAPIYGGRMTATGSVNKITFSSDELPSGLTLAEDGTVTGTAGTYTFKVNAVASAEYSLYSGYLKGTITKAFTQSITITIA